MGAGKSTAARAFAEATGGIALDADAEVERRAGRSISEIFATDGEGAFRAAEERVTLELLDGAARPTTRTRRGSWRSAAARSVRPRSATPCAGTW